jgi:hypothetical protein
MRRWSKLAGGAAVTVLFALWLAPACDEGGSSDEDVTFVADVAEPEQDTGGATPEQDTGGNGNGGCQANCANRECGPDGCGGSCGNCFTLEGALDNSLCMTDFKCKSCGCAGMQCGFDDCGSPCGTCAGNATCNANNQCDAPVVDLNCDLSGFPLLEQQAKANKGPTGFTLHYQSINKTELPFDALVLDIDTAAGGPTGPGSFSATYSNLAQGGLYLYMLKGWNGQTYDTLMSPTEGTINIVSLDPEQGLFKVQLAGVQLQDANFNQASMDVSTLPDGQTWCLDGVELNTELVANQADCVEGGTGFGIGDQIKNFQLQNCNGDWVNLHDACGLTKAIWIVAVAGW